MKSTLILLLILVLVGCANMASLTKSDTARPASMLPGRSDHKNVTAERNGILESVAIGALAVLLAFLARNFALTSTGRAPMRANLCPCGRVMFGTITSKTFTADIIGGVVVI